MKSPAKAASVRRWIISGLAFVFLTGAFGGWIQANVQEWAKATGHDQYLVKYAPSIMAGASQTMRSVLSLFQSDWFIALALLFGGAAIGMWAEYWFRARTSRASLPIALAAATPIAALPLAPPPSAPKPLTAYDAEKKLRVIDLALDILQKDMEPIVNDRHNIADGWIYAFTIPHKTAAEYKDATISYRDAITTTLEMLEKFRAKYSNEQDIIRIIRPTYREPLIKAAESLSEAFARMFVLGQAIPLETEQFLMEPFVTEFKRATQDFVNWRAAAIAELVTMRKAISPL